jgi:hypothetical protein
MSSAYGMVFAAGALALAFALAKIGDGIDITKPRRVCKGEKGRQAWFYDQKEFDNSNGRGPVSPGRFDWQEDTDTLVFKNTEGKYTYVRSAPYKIESAAAEKAAKVFCATGQMPKTKTPVKSGETIRDFTLE